jgi:hypothetical protein
MMASILCAGLLAVAPSHTPVSSPQPGEGKKQGRGQRLKREPHPATQSKPQSESLKRMLGGGKRGQYRKSY